MFGGEVKRKDFALLTESIKSMVIRKEKKLEESWRLDG